ncbi:hypothetical protein Tco_0341120 [Tanacetum coccineum]
MSNHEQPTPSHPRSDVRNTIGKDKQTPQGSARTTSVVDLEEFCEKHYEKLLPIMADKYEYEKRKKEKLEEVKARLDFGDARKKSTRAQESAYSESKTISLRRQRRSRSPHHNPSVFTRLRRERSRSPWHEYKNLYHLTLSVILPDVSDVPWIPVALRHRDNSGNCRNWRDPVTCLDNSKTFTKSPLFRYRRGDPTPPVGTVVTPSTSEVALMQHLLPRFQRHSGSSSLASRDNSEE